MSDETPAIDPPAPPRIDLESTQMRFMRAARPTIRTMVILSVAAVAIYAIALTIVLIRVERSNRDLAKTVERAEQAERDHYFELRQLILLGGTGALHPVESKEKTK